jgi:hypothetical protein
MKQKVNILKCFLWLQQSEPFENLLRYRDESNILFCHHFCPLEVLVPNLDVLVVWKLPECPVVNMSHFSDLMLLLKELSVFEPKLRLCLDDT